MTEKLTVEDGRLKVERVDGKDSLDLDLAEVKHVHFEASQFEGYSGALVLRTEDEEKVVRVDNEDAGTVLEKILPSVTRPAVDATPDESQEPKDAPAPDEAPSAEDSTNRVRSRKGAQRS